MNLARDRNKYITECEPWKVWKTDPKRVETILNISLQLVANLAIAFEPSLPISSKDHRQMINLTEFDWAELGSTDLLKAGDRLGEPHLLFEKIEDETIQIQLDRLEETKKANEAAEAAKDYKAKPIKENIHFDDFEKLDIRVGHIKACEKVKMSNKLLRLHHRRRLRQRPHPIVGIASSTAREDHRKEILFIANLAPRMRWAFVSHGMILSAVNFDDSLAVTTTLSAVKPGSQVQ